MPVDLKNSSKYHPLVRLFLISGDEISFGLPFLFLLLSGIVAFVPLKLDFSREVLVVLYMAMGAQACITLIALHLTIQFRFRRAEHRRLINYVESLRQYTVVNVEGSSERLNRIENGAIPPPQEVPAPDPDDVQQTPLRTRERNSLLLVIAVLCDEAKIDYRKPAAAAVVIKNLAAGRGLSIGETTIENMMKRIPDALEARLIK